MDIKISCKDLQCGEFSSYQSEDTITIIGDGSTSLRQLEKLLKFDKPYHLVIENLRIENNVDDSSEETLFDSNLLSFTSLDVENIEASVFKDCSELEKIDLPSVKNIGLGAFFNCKKLRRVYLPSVQYVDVSAFENCENLR